MASHEDEAEGSSMQNPIHSYMNYDPNSSDTDFKKQIPN